MSKSTSRSTVSVCIVTYNSGRDIGDCLQAALEQSFPISSIIVVDNASSDNTCEIVEAFQEKGVKLIRNDVNRGFAGGHNQARSYTESDYVLVLNPDVILDTDYLANIIDFMDNHPEVGSATGQLRRADDLSVMDSAGIELTADHNARDIASGDSISKWCDRQEIFGVSGAAAVYRTAMIKEVAYKGQFFDEDFFAYKEDVDVAWRARHLGWKAWYIPEAKAIHGRGWKEGGRKSIALFVRKHSYQNRFFTIIKNEPFGKHWLKFLPVFVAKEVAKLIYILLKEPQLLSCWPFIIKKIPDMIRKRQYTFHKKIAKNRNH